MMHPSCSIAGVTVAQLQPSHPMARVSPTRVKRQVQVPIFHLVHHAPGFWIYKADKTAPFMQTSKSLDTALRGRLTRQKLASYDGLAKQIRLLDFTNNQQYIFPSNTGGPISWSPDSTKLIFTDIEQKEDGLRTRVRLADLPLNDTTTLLGQKDERDYSYYSLAWSPAEDSVVLSLRLSDDKPAQVFWLFDPGVLDGIIIADQEDYTYNSPRWDPWGTALLFQQFEITRQTHFRDRFLEIRF